tara:strand:- start:44 stop:166 length:123 start_codon:yes stop_codon:yes gene_type:complete
LIVRGLEHAFDVLHLFVDSFGVIVEVYQTLDSSQNPFPCS